MKDANVFWLLLIAAALGTFALRFSFLALLEKVDMAPWFQRALKYVPPAVMGALVASTLLVADDQLTLHWQNPKLLAAIAAAAVGYFARSLLWTILTGLLVLYVLTQMLGMTA